MSVMQRPSPRYALSQERGDEMLIRENNAHCRKLDTDLTGQFLLFRHGVSKEMIYLGGSHMMVLFYRRLGFQCRSLGRVCVGLLLNHGVSATDLHPTTSAQHKGRNQHTRREHSLVVS